MDGQWLKWLTKPCRAQFSLCQHVVAAGPVIEGWLAVFGRRRTAAGRGGQWGGSPTGLEPVRSSLVRFCNVKRRKMSMYISV